jgi:N-acetylglucosamine kinase-like BadF-type ATPase
LTTVLAVDGGGSKTDVALVRDDGSLVGLARGPLSHPHHIGVKASVAVIQQLVAEAGGAGDLAVLLLAGIDFPDEEEAYLKAATAAGFGTRIIVGNDTFAVLRGGSERGWGVAVTCGAGINCVGIAPDGRQLRFPSLGDISGDWGGGRDVGIAAIFAAARSEDGRGPRTTLEQLVPAYFGYETPAELARAIHLGEVPERAVVELSPLTFAAAADDPVAAEIVDHVADEVVAIARAAITRLDLAREAVDVVLGGGILRSRNERLLNRIEAGLREVGPDLSIHVFESAPVLGSALLGLDELGADDDAKKRLRSDLGAAVARLETREVVR